MRTITRLSVEYDTSDISEVMRIDESTRAIIAGFAFTESDSGLGFGTRDIHFERAALWTDSERATIAEMLRTIGVASMVARLSAEDDDGNVVMEDSVF